MRLKESIILAGGPGSGRKQSGKKINHELYNGMRVKHALYALKHGMKPQKGFDETGTKVYTTDTLSRAQNYAGGFIEIQNDMAKDIGEKPEKEYGVVVIKDKGGLNKQLHSDSDEDETIFKGKIDKKHIDRVDIYDANTDKLKRSVRR